MFFYQAYDQIIHSDTHLFLPTTYQQVPDFTVFFQSEEKLASTVTWARNYDDKAGYGHHCLGKIDQNYIIRFTEGADFLINMERKSIRCFPSKHVDFSTVEHLLLDQVLPCLISRREFLVLHAGTVLCNESVLGFVGKTGSGKSTLTAGLGKCGYPILSDDCLVLRQVKNQIFCIPSYPSIRLNPDSAKNVFGYTDELSRVSGSSNKMRLNLDCGNNMSYRGPELLRALFVLAEPGQKKESDDITIEQCSLREAFGLLIANIFRFDSTDQKSIVREFKNLRTLVSTVPVYRLKYSHQFGLLSKVIQSTTEQINLQNK